VIIDCHGHFTGAPAAHADFRAAQLAHLDDPYRPAPTALPVPDDQLLESLAANQLRVMDERGIDVLLFSPQASSMDHHRTDRATALAWARACNNLVHQACRLRPERLAPVCQLPQTPQAPAADAIGELRRCVTELGFVGANLNPDPSGGAWTAPPLTDEAWFPLYEALVELDVPAMIHVSTSCNPGVHTLGAHYLNADTTVFMQLLQGDLFARFPGLRLVIPHAGGAVPYHWGRFCGLAERLGRPPLRQHLLGNVLFDTCVYHRAGMALLHEVIGPAHLLFASEMLGAVRGVDPVTGLAWDDTLSLLDALDLDTGARQQVVAGNALRVYPRLARWLAAAPVGAGRGSQ
jgi:4-oxalmesaconate hydratase